jgi:hypothetical protein
MKSLNEWRADQLAEEIDIAPSVARAFMGDSTIKVDPNLRSKLRGKLEQLRQTPEYSGLSQEEFFRGIVAAAWSVISDAGTSFSVGKGLRSMEPPKV